MFHPIFALVLVFSFFTISSGQPLPSGRQATVEEARMEQRILANIRPLIKQLGTCEAPTDQPCDNLSQEIRDLTKRILVIEKSLSRQIKLADCIASFENIEMNPKVHVIGGRCYLFGVEYLNWTSAQAKCRSAGANLVTDPSEEFLYFLKWIPGRYGLYFWIGARNTGGILKWITSDEVVKENDSRWGDDDPDVDGPNQCVLVQQGATKMYDYDCDKLFRFRPICQL
ncbi:C-type lectin domain family 2 member D2-like [Pecten maximus]|uniref:C-type lectin domain family 2 member D2-like n=1 Tax=Pecten maximus TaxID=6579 RepID=UPI001458E433|nr:C-type lectin domain family 2 member D2-like [Pecten maximus]